MSTNTTETAPMRLFPKFGVKDPDTGKPVPTFWTLLKSPENASVFKTLIVFTVLIVGLPLTTFFGAQYVLLSGKVLSEDEVLVWSGIASVVALHLVMGAYVIYAWCFDVEPVGEPAALTVADPLPVPVVAKQESRGGSPQPRLRKPASRV